MSFWKDRTWTIGNFAGRRCVVCLEKGRGYLGMIDTCSKKGFIIFNDDTKGSMKIRLLNIKNIVKERDFIGEIIS